MAIKTKLKSIADAIRAKNNTTASMTMEEMVTNIKNISAGASIKNQDKTITANGKYTADSGYTGLGTVTVNVSDSSQNEIPWYYTKGKKHEKNNSVSSTYVNQLAIGHGAQVSAYGLKSFINQTIYNTIDEVYIVCKSDLNLPTIDRLFEKCTNLKHIFIPYLQVIFDRSPDQVDATLGYMLVGVSNCTVHFPAAVETYLAGAEFITYGFEGTNTTVLFDL